VVKTVDAVDLMPTLFSYKSRGKSCPQASCCNGTGGKIT